jgi:hypothetical protein
VRSHGRPPRLNAVVIRPDKRITASPSAEFPSANTVSLTRDAACSMVKSGMSSANPAAHAALTVIAYILAVRKQVPAIVIDANMLTTAMWKETFCRRLPMTPNWITIDSRPRGKRVGNHRCKKRGTYGRHV